MLAPELDAPEVTWGARGRGLVQAAALLTLAQLLMELPHLAGSWDAIADPALWRLLLRSPATWSLGLQLAGLCLLLAARAVPGTLLALLLVFASFAASGHTVTAAHRVPLALVLTLHVLAAAFWLGGLWTLHALLRHRAPGTLVPLLRRFSGQALWLVPLLALAGILLATQLLPGPGALRTPYGLLLLFKGLLYCLLLLLAALNRNRLLPRLAQGGESAGVALRYSVAAELALVATALAATALLSGRLSPN
jgi:putative copper export protein